MDISDAIFFVFKVVAAFAFLYLVEYVLGSIFSLIGLCVFIPENIITVIKASVACVGVSAVYKLFFS